MSDFPSDVWEKIFSFLVVGDSIDTSNSENPAKNDVLAFLQTSKALRDTAERFIHPLLEQYGPLCCSRRDSHDFHCAAIVPPFEHIQFRLAHRYVRHVNLENCSMCGHVSSVVLDILSKATPRLVSLYIRDCGLFHPSLFCWVGDFPALTQIDIEEPLPETIVFLRTFSHLTSISFLRVSSQSGFLVRNFLKHGTAPLTKFGLLYYRPLGSGIVRMDIAVYSKATGPNVPHNSLGHIIRDIGQQILGIHLEISFDASIIERVEDKRSCMFCAEWTSRCAFCCLEGSRPPSHPSSCRPVCLLTSCSMTSKDAVLNGFALDVWKDGFTSCFSRRLFCAETVPDSEQGYKTRIYSIELGDAIKNYFKSDSEPFCSFDFSSVKMVGIEHPEMNCSHEPCSQECKQEVQNLQENAPQRLSRFLKKCAHSIEYIAVPEYFDRDNPTGDILLSMTIALVSEAAGISGVLSNANFLAALFETDRLTTFVERMTNLRTLVVESMESRGSLAMLNLSTMEDNPQQFTHLEMLRLLPTLLASISKACPNFERLVIDLSTHGEGDIILLYDPCLLCLRDEIAKVKDNLRQFQIERPGVDITSLSIFFNELVRYVAQCVTEHKGGGDSCGDGDGSNVEEIQGSEQCVCTCAKPIASLDG